MLDSVWVRCTIYSTASNKAGAEWEALMLYWSDVLVLVGLSIIAILPVLALLPIKIKVTK